MYNILLADDDLDDCIFFKEAINELQISAQITTVHDGQQLMHLLNKMEQLPHVLFLDLNMPRRNGIECLSIIKSNEKLKQLPIVIFTTSIDSELVKPLFEQGAQYYVRKPNEFSQIIKVINEALHFINENCLMKLTKTEHEFN